MTVREGLEKWARDTGCRFAVGPGALHAQVRAEIVARSARRELDAGLVREYLRWIGEESSDDIPAGGWVIAAAVPSPVVLVRFAIPDSAEQGTGHSAPDSPVPPGRTLTATIPPTYVNDARVDQRIREELAETLHFPESGLLPIRSGLKGLAARLGLTRYGLNNIAYIPGIGSYFRLAAFAVHGPVLPGLEPIVPASDGRKRVTGEAHAEESMPDCESCGLCRDSCPAAAIGEDRFLLHAERCLTFFNENPGPWPRWMPKKAHNCLVGCMTCQEACPRNRGMLWRQDSGILFDGRETAAMLSSDPEEKGGAWDSIRTKLSAIGMGSIAGVIGRNLEALLAADG